MFSVLHLASLHLIQHKNHPTRVLKYQEYEHELNMSGIQYPVDIKVIGKFEHQNNISVNAYGYKDKINLTAIYCHSDPCKTSCEFMYQCW